MQLGPMVIKLIWEVNVRTVSKGNKKGGVTPPFCIKIGSIALCFHPLLHQGLLRTQATIEVVSQRIGYHAHNDYELWMRK